MEFQDRSDAQLIALVRQRQGEAFAELSAGCTCPKEFPICVCGKKQELELVNKKPVTASTEEMQENSRSKCAKLRIACKIEA